MWVRVNRPGQVEQKFGSVFRRRDHTPASYPKVPKRLFNLKIPPIEITIIQDLIHGHIPIVDMSRATL